MSKSITSERLIDALARQPRVALSQLPTPLEPAPRLSERLGVRILIKRDDLTGLALGGNKVRKLEFLLGAAKALRADTVITTGGSQSNHARITAAACRRMGLECFLVLDRGVHPELQGNLLLDRLLGAYVRLIESGDPADATAEMRRLADDLKSNGKNPYIIPRGGSVPPGAIGYAAFVPELLGQLAETGVTASHLYLGTGSTGTHSGIVAGVSALAVPLTVQGISVSRTSGEQCEKIFNLSNAVLEYLGSPPSAVAEQIRVDDAYRGPGYGVAAPGTYEAIEIAALDEGLILDPVYTGKAMAGLIDHARQHRFGPRDTVVFLHTGGAPALFAYSAEISQVLLAE